MRTAMGANVTEGTITGTARAEITTRTDSSGAIGAGYQFTTASPRNRIVLRRWDADSRESHAVVITRISLSLNGQNAVLDLIWEGGIPVVVAEWGGPLWMPRPEKKLRLDPAHLRPVSVAGPVHWRYLKPITYGDAPLG